MTKSHYLNQHSGDGTWSEIIGDVQSGVAVGVLHSKWFAKMLLGTGWNAIASLGGFETEGGIETVGGDNDTERRGGSSSTNSENQHEKKGLKVVGVGYGRTGTYSLALALDDLGFPTLHTQHLYENGEIFDHVVYDIFHKSIQEDEIIMGNPDFSLLTNAGFAATMDLPFALYYDQIHEQYPDCKFILTVRENSDVWFRSWNVLASNIVRPAQYTSFMVTHVKKLEYYMRWLFSVVNHDKTFLSHPFPLPPQNKQNAISSYETHNQRVRDSIPPSNLLEYNVRQGWEPLCEFLEIPQTECPSAKGIPFPKSNSARAVKWQSYSSFIAFISASLFIIFSIFSLVFRKITGMSVIGWMIYVRGRFLRFASNKLEKRGKNRAKMD